MNISPVCTIGNCFGNIEFEAGSKLANCLSCKKRMLLKNCPKFLKPELKRIPRGKKLCLYMEKLFKFPSDV